MEVYSKKRGANQGETKQEIKLYTNETLVLVLGTQD